MSITNCLYVLTMYRHGQVKCLRMLLERSAVVGADKTGVTPLQLCAQVDDLQAMRDMPHD